MNQLKSATDVLTTDFDRMTRALSEELKVMQGKSLLLTGGAGFLGYYLTQTITHYNASLAPSDRVRLTVFDNFIRGTPAWLQAKSDEGALGLSVHDVRMPLPKDMGAYSFIIHAASIASPIYYRKYPIETMDANVHGLRSLLDYALERATTDVPVEGFLFFSSSEIYGDPTPDMIPTPEDYRGFVSCTGPRACYDESKRYGETLCVNFAQQHGVPVRVARPFNNYGPGLKITDRRVLPDFARDVLAGRDIVLLSDGSPMRTFCYVADAVVGYLKILVRGRSGEAYNIGIDKPEINMRTLADKVCETARTLWDYQGQVVFQSSQDAAYLTDNPNRRCPVIDKARAELGYAPKVGIDEGLLRSLLWYRENKEGADA